jgi:hypothetical protein
VFPISSVPFSALCAENGTAKEARTALPKANKRQLRKA